MVMTKHITAKALVVGGVLVAGVGLALSAAAASSDQQAVSAMGRGASTTHRLNPPSPEPAPDPRSSTGFANGWQTRAALGTTKLDAVGADDARYASVAVDQKDRVLVVYRTPGPSEVTYPAAIEGIPVRVKPALLSHAEAERTFKAFLDARGYLQRQDVRLTGAGTDGEGPVFVNVQPVSERTRQILGSIAPLGMTSIVLRPAVVASGESARHR